MATTRDVHLFVVDTLADWEPGLAIAHVNHPTPGGPSRYVVKTVGLSRAPVRTRGGVTIIPDLALAEVRPADSALLILPGSDLWADKRTDPALALAQEFVDAGVPVAAICGATLGLARVGLLDHRRHTGNDPDWLATSGYQGRSLYVREPAVEDRGIITASATAPVDFARLILARLAVFKPATLEAWYGLFKTHDPTCFFAFMKGVEKDGLAPQQPA